MLKGQEGIFSSVAVSHGVYIVHSKADLEVFLPFLHYMEEKKTL